MFEVKVYRPTNSRLEFHRINAIVEALKFKNHPIILCERGKETITLNPNELIEVTEKYKVFEKLVIKE